MTLSSILPRPLQVPALPLQLRTSNFSSTPFSDPFPRTIFKPTRVTPQCPSCFDFPPYLPRSPWFSLTTVAGRTSHWFIRSSSIRPALEHGWGLPPRQAHWSHFTFITTTTRTPLILPSNPNFLVHYILPSSETYFLCSHFPLIFCLL